MPPLRSVLDPTKTGFAATCFEKELRKRVVGQEEAIDEIVNVYQMHLAGLCPPGRPVGNFLFLGPTGTGKTKVIEACAEALFSNPQALLKVDCGEFQHSHEICKLIGAPPSYLGHKETMPMLCQENLNKYQTPTCQLTFLLFDEIEKASDSLWNLLLGILDKATLTLGDNRKVDFSKCLIFLTSNLGASEMSTLTGAKLGFAKHVSAPSVSDKKIKRSGIEEARRKFTPEFMNRLDKVVTFAPLGQEQLRQILHIELGQVQQRILLSPIEKSFVLTVSDAGKDFLLQEGTDLRYGARHLKRAIERYLMQPIANLMATDQIRTGDWVEAGFDSQARCLVFTKEAESLETQTMANMIGGNFVHKLPAVLAEASLTIKKVAK